MSSPLRVNTTEAEVNVAWWSLVERGKPITLRNLARKLGVCEATMAKVARVYHLPIPPLPRGRRAP